ncbi:hypothetical protein [Nocardia sp. NPDC052112]|uniref:hypothetical protein n=1 Tax=Nocardia sp. NPDC052112 TaxID=3155646 RepID=UPI003419461E
MTMETSDERRIVQADSEIRDIVRAAQRIVERSTDASITAEAHRIIRIARSLGL